ncbi:hypothetical protein [Clostridium senegalense]|uniref:Uncharacterized protein n=1 Tax=Clostridium senegalense TaxID=1465809 RepID=A0A6M0H4F8_9CLOT|nr:hypothetical protein [Clostridium senegalense]NEU05489.1 hypothetical protein [Clostridium senegalense]
MKSKVISVIQWIIYIVTIVTVVAYFLKKVIIPGLIPFLISILMLSLIYTSRKRFNNGEISKNYYIGTISVEIIAFIIYMIICISEIISVLN